MGRSQGSTLHFRKELGVRPRADIFFRVASTGDLPAIKFGSQGL